jgi:hypothetical protein
MQKNMITKPSNTHVTTTNNKMGITPQTTLTHISFPHPHVSNAVRSHRHDMHHKYISNNQETHALYYKKYTLTDTAKKYLTDNAININSFESCEGNLLQQTIHNEFIILTDTTAHLLNEQKNSKEINELTTVIADFTIAGITFNHTGETGKAIAFANACWAIFDCIEAAGEGIVEGISSVAHDLMHPIETALIFTDAVIKCGYYLNVALQEVCSLTGTIIYGDFNAAHNKYASWSEHFKNIAQVLSEKCEDLTLHDAIKTTTATIIQSYATTRALNGLSTFFNHAHHSATLIAKKINDGIQESSLLMSAEGIPIRIAQETLKHTKQLPRANDKLLHLLSQFESQKIKVGNVTCVLDKSGLKHILERHHPIYWAGKIKDSQTFLPKDMTIPDIVKIIEQVIKQNKKLIISKGTNGMYKITGVIKNTKYIVGFDNGRIGQFYIPSIQ